MKTKIAARVALLGLVALFANARPANADAVTDQLVTGAQSGRLAGLTLSGASALDCPYGPAWADAHLPLLSADPASRSLLDEEHLRTAVIAVADAPWLGLKVSRMPGDVTAEQVLRTVARNLALVQDADVPGGQRWSSLGAQEHIGAGSLTVSDDRPRLSGDR